MNIIVSDSGFAPCIQSAQCELPPDTDPVSFDFAQAKDIAILFPNSADGRGFGIARVLRDRGYSGVLRAKGHVLPDQYAMARRIGFDVVEISCAQAERQPQSDWLFRANWKAGDYQARLGQKRMRA